MAQPDDMFGDDDYRELAAVLHEATRDNIRHYAHGIGDDNPLWTDPDYAAFDDTVCEVVMMSGLPGAGKDFWVAENLADCPVVSLDALFWLTAAKGRLALQARDQVTIFLGSRDRLGCRHLRRDAREVALLHSVLQVDNRFHGLARRPHHSLRLRGSLLFLALHLLLLLLGLLLRGTVTILSNRRSG